MWSGAVISFCICKIALDTAQFQCYNKKAYGALAQLGARHIRIVKARGSTPLCSTKLKRTFKQVKQLEVQV